MLAADFRQHHGETEQQAAMVRERLEAHGGSPSAVKDAVMKLGGKGFLLFARMMPETPGRLAAHAYSYEAMEWAGYEMLRRFADRADDPQTVETAGAIAAQERAMMERLERGFDAAENASHRDLSLDKAVEHVPKHLAEAHALESQGERLLKKSEEIAGDAQLTALYDEGLESTRRHLKRLEARLNSLRKKPSLVEDAALAVGGLNWSYFFQAQSDTAAKLAAFVYAVQHLKIAGYELLRRSAGRAGDGETQALCEEILAEERGYVERLAGSFDIAAQATLEKLRK